uniref:Uncharacterized protein n=1 Tax=Timema douglasi TaxID=61478 RepID=A0A7R8VWH3_TIMDO|nr:unnamed protein product [Timema douglasi]
MYHYHFYTSVPSEKKLSRNKTLSSRLLAKFLRNKHLQLTNLSTMLDPLRQTLTDNGITFLTIPPYKH